MGSDGFRVVRIVFIGNWDPKKFLEMQRRNPQIKPEEYQFIKANATDAAGYRHGNARP